MKPESPNQLAAGKATGPHPLHLITHWRGLSDPHRSA